MTRRIEAALLAGGIPCVLVAACQSTSGGGGSLTGEKASGTQSTTAPSTAPPSPTTLTVAAAGKLYLDIITPSNNADDRMDTQLGDLSPNATAADLDKVTAPAVKALNTAVDKLLRVDWPTPQTSTDVRAECQALSVLSGDLADLSSVTVLDESSTVDTLKHDASVADEAAQAVRADLGLPATD